jgi:hypothetical protein
MHLTAIPARIRISPVISAATMFLKIGSDGMKRAR